MELKQVEKISKALGDITRLKILTDMVARGGEIECAQLMDVTGLAQPSVSHHIKTLLEAGLIEREKDGRTYSYFLNKPLITGFSREITKLAEK